jgi:hypothetical protein
MALDKTNGNVYKYTNDSWGNAICNIKGPQGQKGDKGETGADAGWFTKTTTFTTNYQDYLLTISNLTTDPIFSPYVKVIVILKKRGATLIRTFKFGFNLNTEETHTAGTDPTVSVKAYVSSRNELLVHIELDNTNFYCFDSCTVSYLKL